VYVKQRGGGENRGEKTDKNGDFPCFFGLAVVVLGYSQDGLGWDRRESCEAVRGVKKGGERNSMG